MPSVSALQAVMGVSSFLGVVGLLAYLYYSLQVLSAQRSISHLIEGQAAFSATDIIAVLEKFNTDDGRLNALKELTRYSDEKARRLLEKVKSNVDVNKLSGQSDKQNRQRSLITAVVFLILAASTFAYYKIPNAPVAAVSPPNAPAITAPQPAPAASTVAREPVTETLTFHSGPQPSGTRKNFSSPYELCTSGLPAGATIISDSFALSGDRACGAWSECSVSTRSSTRVCWKFSLQGHDELPGDGVRVSEGHLTVQIQRPADR